jgi:eukaryotic-like serine/threonine-protein kinase
MLTREGLFATGVAMDAKPAPETVHRTQADIATPIERKLGPYVLIRKLADGGMSSVWLARYEVAESNGATTDEFAIKLPHRGTLSGDVVRFRQEGEILATLSHPNIARLVDAGVDEGSPYLVLTCVRGQPITEFAQARQLTLKERLRLFLQVLSAVQYAHGRLVLHRDLKPSNIFVNAAGEVRLLDFGVAKLLSTADAPEQGGDLTMIFGRAMTPLYASPEQLRGEPLTIASDVYSLGLVLYELLVDKRARNDDSGGATAILAKVLANPPPKPSQAHTNATAAEHIVLPSELKGDIDAIVGKALAIDTIERYATVDALAEDLVRFLEAQPVHARTPTLWYRTQKVVSRHRVASALAVTAIVGIATTAAVALWQRSVAIEQRDSAKAEVDRRVKSHGFLIRLISEYAPKDKPLTSVELLDLGVNSVEKYFKDDFREMVAMLLRLNGRYIELGETEREKHATFKALGFAQKSGEPNLIAGTNCMAAKVMALTDIEAARSHLETARSAYASAKDPSVGIRAECWFNEINVLQQAGEYAKASAVAEEAMDFFRTRVEASRNVFYASMLNAAGKSYTNEQRFGDAERVFQELLVIDEKAGLVGTSSNWVSQANLLEVWLKAGDYARAVNHIEQVLLPIVAGDRSKLPPSVKLRWAAIAAARGQSQLASELLGTLGGDSLGSLALKHAKASATVQRCYVDGNSACLERELTAFTSTTKARFVFNRREQAVSDLISAQFAFLAERYEQAVIDAERGIALARSDNDDSLAILAQLFELRARARLSLRQPAAALADAEAAIALIERHMKYPKERSARYGEALLIRAEARAANGDLAGATRDATASNNVLSQQLERSHSSIVRAARVLRAK